jgi:AmmeMemoRadiSam system protein B
MTTVRRPAVSGRFYPGRTEDLARDLDRLLTAARPHAVSDASPKALIVPHAGYAYSGATAALGYVLLERLRTRIRRVVLLGPSHYIALRGLALPDAEAFDTPLGRVPVERADHLLDLPQVSRSDLPHLREHSLEVQLPFVQRVLDAVTLVPLVVGDATPEEVAEVVEACWGGPETVVLISSDLSHYRPYADARAVDADTVRRILALQGPLPDARACGARGVNGMLLVARQRGLRPSLVDCRNSGDTAGDRVRVVGYASISFEEVPDDQS